MIPKDFGARVRALRSNKKLTQSQLAKRIGIHYIHLGRYEQGKTTPNGTTLVKLARALDVSLDYLVWGPKAETHLEDQELFVLFKAISQLQPQDRIDAKRMISNFIAERKFPRD